MNTINRWYSFKNVLDKDTCDRILEICNTHRIEEDVKTHESTKEDFEVAQQELYGEETNVGEIYFDLSKKECNSDVSWSNEDWIYNITWPYLHEANNEAGWKYDITGAESMRILRYNEGGFYAWHLDGFNCHYSTYDRPHDAVYHGNVRKLSMIIYLNDGYEGGEFQIANYKHEKCEIVTPIPPEAGSIIVHPADLEHRVDTVTKGTRYTLVVWYVGPPFK